MAEISLTRPLLFIDFDGTITGRDAVDAILEEFADERWLLIEEEWRAGRIGSRDCLGRQMELVRASREEMNALLDSIELDEGFEELLEICGRLRVPLQIVSDGFDYCIQRILARPELASVSDILKQVPVYSSHLEPSSLGPEAGAWSVDFPFYHNPCTHGCATCKPAVMRRSNPAGAPVIFVGDGLSDAYAVSGTDILFAKKTLASYCKQSEIPFLEYDDLRDIAISLAAIIKSGVPLNCEQITTTA